MLTFIALDKRHNQGIKKAIVAGDGFPLLVGQSHGSHGEAPKERPQKVALPPASKPRKGAPLVSG